MGTGGGLILRANDLPLRKKLILPEVSKLSGSDSLSIASLVGLEMLLIEEVDRLRPGSVIEGLWRGDLRALVLLSDSETDPISFFP